MRGSMASRIARLREVRRKYGVWAVAQLLVDRALNRFGNVIISNLICVDAASAGDPPGPDPRFEFRFLSPNELATFAHDPAHELDSEFVVRASLGHDVCFAALDGSRLASYGWFALGCIEREHCEVAMSYPAHVAYSYKGFTHPEYRGRGLYAAVKRRALDALAARGVTTMVSSINWTTWASLRSNDRIGYRKLGRMVLIEIRGRQWAKWPRGHNGLDIRFGPQADLSSRASHRAMDDQISGVPLLASAAGNLGE